jgi:hypothetical protein
MQINNARSTLAIGFVVSKDSDMLDSNYAVRQASVEIYYLSGYMA